MSAIALDYTLSQAHFDTVQVAFADHYDRPNRVTPWPMIERASKLLSGAHIFNEHAIGFVTSSLAVIGFASARDALDISLEVEKTELLRKVQQNLFDPNVLNDVDAISETIDHTYELISRWGSSVLDLNNVIGAGNAIHLAAILRVTSDSSERIPGWHAALSYVVELMNRQGIDTDDALFGLIA